MTNNKAAFYFERLLEVFNKNKNNDRNGILEMYSVLTDIADDYVAGEKEIFTGPYPKIHFMLNKSGLINKPEYDEILKFRKFVTIINKNPNLSAKKTDFLFSFHLLSLIISNAFDAEIPNKIAGIISGKQFGLTFSIFKPVETSETKELDVVVTGKNGKVISGKGNKASLKIISDESPLEELELTGLWVQIYDLARNLSKLKIIDPVITDDKIVATHRSIVVLEPDVLYDATELSECFQHNGSNPHLYFLKLFTDSKPSFPMVNGNIVNTLFDELINDNEVEYESAFDKALKQKPLSIAAVALNENINKTVERLNFIAKPHFENLKNIIKEFRDGFKSVEPTFISAKYGLQGRLDLLIESEDNTKDIIELKSGRPPKTNYFSEIDNKRVPIGIWRNHLAQTTIYNILLDSTYKERKGNSAILYSSDGTNPLRNSINSLYYKQEVIMLRNIILTYEIMLSEGKYQILKMLTPERIGIIPPFTKEEFENFYMSYSSLDKTGRMYFKLFTSFVFREIFSQRTGHASENTQGGQSSLWSMPLDEKIKKYIILNDLEILPESSNLEKQHLLFKISCTHEVTVFRKGDTVVLYPQESSGTDPLKNQIIKCVIKDISTNYVKISLRNKLSNTNYFFKFKHWIIEPDYNLSTIKKQLGSIFEVISSPKEKRNIIIGRKKPEFTSEIPDKNKFSYLNASQYEILKKAVNAKNYFLIQGPPGTGKTSYMLRSILEHILQTTDENILLSAYTNRAVDEICSVLKTIPGNIEFVRLGSRESSEHQDVLISNIVDSGSLMELQRKLLRSRIIVSTTSSLIQNKEIFELKKFDIAIVDEASQILEPQIAGILTKVTRFILIGDEKQLPAIVTQNENMQVKSLELIEICLDNPAVSYFERILKVCLKNGWTDAFGMLKNQARMHKDIQDFPSENFYEKELKVFDLNRQTSKTNIFSKSRNFGKLSASRISFISSEREFNSKINESEAELIKKLVVDIHELSKNEFSRKTIGIITPFRAQCALIRKKLPSELKDLITVDTVERFQGSEKDFIIFSFAVNYPHSLKQIINPAKINGTLIDRKFNVALTRAREYLIITGYEPVLKEFEIYNKFIEFAKSKNSKFKLNDIMK